MIKKLIALAERFIKYLESHVADLDIEMALEKYEFAIEEHDCDPIDSLFIADAQDLNDEQFEKLIAAIVGKTGSNPFYPYDWKAIRAQMVQHATPGAA